MDKTPLNTTPIVGVGFARLDDDGTGPDHHDRDHKPQLSGKNMNADTALYLVAPLRLIARGLRAGDTATVAYQGKTIHTIVGDFGPDSGQDHANGFGEMSLALATALGIPWKDTSRGPVTTGGKRFVTVTYYPHTHKAPVHPKHKQVHLKHHKKPLPTAA